jgi:hypothetical protein
MLNLDLKVFKMILAFLRGLIVPVREKPGS